MPTINELLTGARIENGDLGIRMAVTVRDLADGQALLWPLAANPPAVTRLRARTGFLRHHSARIPSMVCLNMHHGGTWEQAALLPLWTPPARMRR